jgi:Ca-activated chloride channel family protein
MSFLTPLFLLLGLLAAPIILLYMLRLRRREMMVSSTMLWQKLLRDREANAPWQKLRRNLLLILQLIILAALVLALARPFLPVPTVVSGSVVVLLDGSASMLATDVEPNRFEAAKGEVEELIGELGGGDQMTLILVGRTPSVLASATGDQNRLRDALDQAQPGPAASDWAAAFALATGAAQGFQDARIVVVSDGGLPADLPPLPAEAVYIPVGRSGENLAISALATRDTESGPQLFASVQNHGRLDQPAVLSLSLDGTLYDSRRIEVPAGSTANISWQLPEGAAVIEARLTENEEDFLALDNVAWAVHEGGVSNRTLLVTPGNIFLERVYAVLPGIEAFKAAPEEPITTEGGGEFDLYVFDSVPLPDLLPAADMLIVNPQGENGLFQVTGIFTGTPTLNVTRLSDNPLLQFVDWSEVHIRQAKSIEAGWAQRLIESEQGPLLLTGEQNGYRVAIITFDLHDSDLPLQIAFPILMANITGWLSPGRAFDAPTGLQPGDPIGITPGASSTEVAVVKPDGSPWSVDVGEEAIFFTESDQLGLYTVELRDEAGTQPAGSFAVNLFAPVESALQPAEAVTFGQTTIESAAEGDVGQRELWPWLAAVAFLVLIVEWWVHHRGTRWPQLPGRAS